MERNVTVRVQATGVLKSFNASGLETVADLKRVMLENGIDPEGKDILEGISNTQLMADNSILPTNTMFQGSPTNNLVILLVTKNKKVASGALSRKEAYEQIKNLNLEEAVKEAFGRNFTQVSTENLNELLSKKNTPKVSEKEITKTDAHKEDGLKRFLTLIMWGTSLEEAAQEVLVSHYGEVFEASGESEYDEDTLEDIYARIGL